MGFNQYQYGNIHACWIENGYVCHETACTHVIHKYPTRLQVNIPKQVNPFVSFTVAFLLYHEDKVYVGRYDGGISIYRKSDKMLVGLNNWDAPAQPPLILVGFFNSPGGLNEVYLDTRDRQTVYMKWRRIEAALDRPFMDDYTDIFDVEAMAPAPTFDSWALYNRKGEHYGINVWYIQNELWRQNCPIYI